MSLKLLSAAAIFAVVAASPAFACEQHQTHAAVTAAAEPQIVAPVEAAVALPQSPITEDAALSVAPEPMAASGGFGRCGDRKRTTVYLTN